jgi:hypothetical protein
LPKCLYLLSFDGVSQGKYGEGLEWKIALPGFGREGWGNIPLDSMQTGNIPLALQKLFLSEARKHKVLPLDDRLSERFDVQSRDAPPIPVRPTMMPMKKLKNGSKK